MEVSSVLLSIIIVLITLLVYYFKRHLSYWKRRGIPHDTPTFPHGNMKGLGKKYHLRDITQKFYEKFKKTGPFGGFFFFLHPAVVIFDLDLIKNILIKDFNRFVDRGMYSNERDDPLTGNLLRVDGAKWRCLRNKLTSTFSSAKMKGMFPMVLSVADKLHEIIDKMIETDPIIEVKDILARYTVDVIGTCAFGIDCNNLNDPEAEFRIAGEKALSKTRHSNFVTNLIISFPSLAEKLGMRIVHEEVHQFFTRVVRQTIEYREKNSIKRDDFMNLLIEVKNSEAGLTINEIAAQSFVFFMAGYETSATSMGFALYELALNQAIQDKLRAEINVQFEKNGGQFTYDSIPEMHYMEVVMKETLRKHSVAINVVRRSSTDYPTSNPKYVIPKGIKVIIPVDAIHRDPDIYPEPEKFDPERFSPEEVQKRHPITWLPFGDGPRNCIGMRFGKMQTYIGLSMLLRYYRFYCSDKTPQPLLPNLRHFLMSSRGGIYLRVERIM